MIWLTLHSNIDTKLGLAQNFKCLFWALLLWSFFRTALIHPSEGWPARTLSVPITTQNKGLFCFIYWEYCLLGIIWQHAELRECYKDVSRRKVGKTSDVYKFYLYVHWQQGKAMLKALFLKFCSSYECIYWEKNDCIQLYILHISMVLMPIFFLVGLRCIRPW